MWVLVAIFAIIILAVCFVGLLSWEVIVAFCEQGYTGWVIVFLVACVAIWLLVRD